MYAIVKANLLHSSKVSVTRTFAIPVTQLSSWEIGEKSAQAGQKFNCYINACPANCQILEISHIFNGFPILNRNGYFGADKMVHNFLQ